MVRCGSLDLKGYARTPSSKKHRRVKGIVVVNELGGQYEDTFRDVEAQIFNLFTYKAVRTVTNQLYEMNPTEYRWFYDFVVTNKPNDGKRFLRVLQKEKHGLAERVMVTHLHLYGKWFKDKGFVVGQAVLKAEASKVAKHEKVCLENQHVFVPFAFDTFGVLARDAVRLLNRVQKVVNSNSSSLKNVDNAQMYKDLSEQNLALMRERLMETVICPSEDNNWETYD